MRQLVNNHVCLESRAHRQLHVWIDSRGRSVNVFDAEMLESLESAIEHIETAEQAYALVVFRSRKPRCFFAGADVHSLAKLDSAEEARAIVERGQQLMQRLAGLSLPTVAAIDGMCIGGGLEFALACKLRVASDSSHTQLGLPEIKLGLIPGWGGTQRLPRIVGLRSALDMILTGRSVASGKALKLGLVDQVLSRSRWDEELERCLVTIAEGASSLAHPRRSVASRLLDNSYLGRKLVFRAARINSVSKARQYPALAEAIAAIQYGLEHPGQGLACERDAFLRLLFSATAGNLIGLFMQQDRAKKVATWVEHHTGKPNPKAIEKVAVVGAGAMGAGIGALAVSKGMRVAFKEADPAASEAGRRRVEAALNELVKRSRLSTGELQACLGRTSFTSTWDETSGCELAIEAVVEIEAVKRDVFQALDRTVGREAILTSNTSSLNVTQMSTATCAARRPYIAGLHFFNPVDKMQLVEVVRTEATSEATIGRLLDFVRALGKTPIVTSDKPGFLVNRVLFAYLAEALRLVQEGISLRDIDRSMRGFGMPMGPLELLDHVGLDVAAHVARSLAHVQHDTRSPAQLLDAMVTQGWLGAKSRCGFYSYAGAKPRANDKLLARVCDPIATPVQRHRTQNLLSDGLTDIQRRLVYPLLNEAVHCLDEAVVSAAWMVDLGMVLGTGFAPQRGGPMRCIDAMGAKTVLHNLRILESAVGARFHPADGLVRSVRSGKKMLSESSNSLSWENHDESQTKAGS